MGGGGGRGLAFKQDGVWCRLLSFLLSWLLSCLLSCLFSCLASVLSCVVLFCLVLLGERCCVQGGCRLERRSCKPLVSPILVRDTTSSSWVPSQYLSATISSITIFVRYTISPFVLSHYSSVVLSYLEFICTIRLLYDLIFKSLKIFYSSVIILSHL